MRLLVLSDIHANLEALDAVWQAAAGQFDRCYCLGDVVGYGANPNECASVIRERAIATIRGNHDRACLAPETAADFNANALAAIRWTAGQLTSDTRPWLAQLPSGPMFVEGIRLAHGMPQDEDEYLLTAQQAAAALAAAPCSPTFVGHTHLQGGYCLSGQGCLPLDLSPAQPWSKLGSEGACLRVALVSGAKYLINPGSVGQPRDGDWRAAFLIHDDAGTVEFHRVPYALSEAQRKIRAAGLPAVLADRLAFGR